MDIETVRTREPGEEMPEEPRTPGTVDVSDVPAARVPEVARDADVYLERRGGRTYLVPV